MPSWLCLFSSQAIWSSEPIKPPKRRQSYYLLPGILTPKPCWSCFFGRLWPPKFQPRHISWTKPENLHCLWRFQVTRLAASRARFHELFSRTPFTSKMSQGTFLELNWQIPTTEAFCGCAIAQGCSFALVSHRWSDIWKFGGQPRHSRTTRNPSLLARFISKEYGDHEKSS